MIWIPRRRRPRRSNPATSSRTNCNQFSCFIFSPPFFFSDQSPCFASASPCHHFLSSIRQSHGLVVVQYISQTLYLDLGAESLLRTCSFGPGRSVKEGRLCLCVPDTRAPTSPISPTCSMRPLRPATDPANCFRKPNPFQQGEV